MINIRNLYVSFTKEFDALHNINLSVSGGERVALVGDLDSGKTTLLRVIAGLENVAKGEVYVNGISIDKIDYKQDLSVGYIPKSVVFKENKTVLQNLEYVLKIRNLDSASINFKILSAIKTFNIESIKNVTVKSLTPFQKMLVQIARVSMRKVDLFLIDSITEDFVKSEQEKLLGGIKTLLELYPKSTFLIAFSNEKMAKELGLKIVKIKLGSIESPKADVKTKQQQKTEK